VAGIVSHLDADHFYLYGATSGGLSDPLDRTQTPMDVGYPSTLGSYFVRTTSNPGDNQAQYTYFVAAWEQQEGWRPMVLTLPGEPHPAADLVMVAPRTVPTASTSPDLYVYRYRQETGGATATWQPDGVPLSGDARDATIVQAAGGHTHPTYYVGEQQDVFANAGTGQQLGKRLFRSVRDASGNLVGWDCIWPGPADNAHKGECTTSTDRAWFFESDPYDANVVYVLTNNGVMLSTNGGLPLSDGTSSWRLDDSLTQWLSHRGPSGSRIFIPCTINCAGSGAVEYLGDMEFSPREPGTRFAAGEAGVFFTADGASQQADAPGTWHRLLDATAMACMSKSVYFDPTSDTGRTLYVGCEGRGVLKLAGIPTQAQVVRGQFHVSPYPATSTFHGQPAPGAPPRAPNPSQPPPGTGGLPGLVVAPDVVAQACVNPTSVLPPIQITLSNPGGTGPVNWAASVPDDDAAQVPWASVSPSGGTLPDGKQDTLMISPGKDLCGELQKVQGAVSYRVNVTIPGSNTYSVTDIVTPPDSGQK
jgi:hypothetical protein